METIESIPVILDFEDIRAALHVRDENQWKRVEPLLNAAKSFQARAAYRISSVEVTGEDSVVLDGISLKSKVLKRNVEAYCRVFPYVVTLGAFEEIAGTCDMLDRYYLDVIGNRALSSARGYLVKHLQSAYALGELAWMSPGSLADWPVEQQGPLFAILGDVEASIGVRLTDSFMMQPTKSVSGVFFPTENSFSSCKLCMRKACPSRRAAFDPETVNRYGIG